MVLPVTRFIMTVEAAEHEIPLILKDDPEQIPPHTNDLGTNDFSSPIQAVVFGGGYSQDDCAHIREVCAQRGVTRKLPFLVADTSKPAPPLGPEYGKAILKRAKDAILALEVESKMGKNELGLQVQA